MSPAQKISDLNEQLQRAVKKPHTDAILDSLLFIQGAHTAQSVRFTRFLLCLLNNEPVCLAPLKSFSNEVRGWCLSWVSAYMRGEVNEYSQQINTAAERFLVTMGDY